MDEYQQVGNASRADDIVVKKPQGLYSSVEFLMFAFYFAKTLSDVVIVNLLERSACLVILNYNFTNCTEYVSPSTEGVLQQSAADLLMVRSVGEALIPSFLTLFIGPWSDTNGRRPLILMSLNGYFVSALIWCVLSVIPGLHPVYFLLASVPVALNGGYVSFFLALNCYVSDITEYNKRAFRMGLVMAGCLLGILFSSLIAPYLLDTSVVYGYTVVFATSALLMFITLNYAYWCVPESVNVIQSERTKLWRLDHVKDVFSTSFRVRANHIRTIVMCIIINLGIYVVLFEGELSVLYLFSQKQFLWTLVDYTRFTVFVIVVSGVSMVFCMWFFTSVLKLNDLPLMFLGTLSLLCKAIVYTLATNGLFLYVANGVGVLSILLSPLSRSQLSKLIPGEDLGKIFAFTSFIESTAPLTAAPIYMSIYKNTMDTMPNTVFWLSTGLCTISVLLIGSAVWLLRRCPTGDYRSLLVDDDGTGTSVQNS